MKPEDVITRDEYNALNELSAGPIPVSSHLYTSYMCELERFKSFGWVKEISTRLGTCVQLTSRGRKIYDNANDHK